MFQARDKTLTIPMVAPDTLCDDIDDKSEFPQRRVTYTGIHRV